MDAAVDGECCRCRRKQAHGVAQGCTQHRYQPGYKRPGAGCRKRQRNCNAASGARFEMGMGVAQDYSSAYSWYKLAYDRGSNIAEQHAITCLRLCYENNIFPDGGESFLRTCANKRNTKAMISLAYYYRFFNSDGRDFSEALRYYRQAAESGDSEAQYLLGRFLVMKNLLKRERNKVISLVGFFTGKRLELCRHRRI